MHATLRHVDDAPETGRDRRFVSEFDLGSDARRSRDETVPVDSVRVLETAPRQGGGIGR